MKYPALEISALCAFSAYALAAVHGNCAEFTIPITVFANNTKYDIDRVESNIDVVQFVLSIETWNAVPPQIKGQVEVGGDFNIHAQLCIPSASYKPDNILLIASHGVAFDKREFDPGYRSEEFSFVDAALASGYAILTYDRLGTGRSSLPDAYDELQTPLQAEVLRSLTEKALDGIVLTAKSSAFPGPLTYKANRVVHIGHSYGSVVTNYFLGRYGSLSAGAILTGYFIGNETSAFHVQSTDLMLASDYDPIRYANRPSGYVAFGSINAFELVSLRAETLDPYILTLWNDKLQSTLAVGELLSISDGTSMVIDDFTGPLLMFNGELDFDVCGGDCKGTYNISVLKTLYPKAVDLEVYLQAATGHVVHLSLNATAGYKIMFNYLEDHNL